MWAIGTVIAEVLTLRPLFPGSSLFDQIVKICDVLGNPSNESRVDATGRLINGDA
jgi:meiosis induction protein kinase IME2/SME1